MGNMKNLSNIMEGYSPYKELREQTKGLVKKWEQTGLLEGLGGESEVHGMSILLENQARQLIDESSKTGYMPQRRSRFVLRVHGLALRPKLEYMDAY